MEIPEMFRIAQQKGWRVELTGGNHRRALSPDGKHTVIAASTPSDHRAHMNVKLDFKRAGLDMDLTDDHSRDRVKKAVKEFFRSDQRVHGMENVVVILRARYPAFSPGGIRAAIARLHAVGSLTRLGRGEYQWAHRSEDAVETEQAAPVAGVVTSEPLPSVEDLAPAIEAAPAPIEKEKETDDLDKAVNDLLDAMGRIQTIVAKAQRTIEQLNKIRGALSGLGS